MRIIEAVQNMLHARTEEYNESDWNKLKDALMRVIETCENVEELKEGLKIDESDILPFEPKMAMHERLIKFERSKENLQEYAWWLQMNGGPDWDGKAEELLREAELK